jgi:hypothetical protein
LVETGLVLIVNAFEVVPAATVTVLGGATVELFVLRFTTNPPEGAALVKVTVPVAVWPCITDEGEIVKVAIGAGLSVSVALSLTPFREAVIVTFTTAVT